jgi:hypothetical protein
MHKGCGSYAMQSVIRYSLVWTTFNFALYFEIFISSFHQQEAEISIWLLYVLYLITALFYVVLWLAPQKRLYRRPAILYYAKFWSWFHFVTAILFVFIEFSPWLDDYDTCSLILLLLIVKPLLVPFMCYHTLLQDSLWWQGLDIYRGKLHCVYMLNIYSSLIIKQLNS